MKKVRTMMYTCLECRKAFKKDRYELGANGTWKTIDYEIVCPQCGCDLYETGMAFKAPKKTDTRAWGKVGALLREGYRFDPDLGDPFNDPVPPKIPKAKVPESVFRRPARKRDKMPNKPELTDPLPRRIES